MSTVPVAVSDRAVQFVASSVPFKVTASEVASALGTEVPSARAALREATAAGLLSRSGPLWSVTDAGRDRVTALSMLRSTDNLTDYVWGVMEWLTEHDGNGTRHYSATQISKADTPLRGDHGFILVMLKVAERHGLVQRQRNGVSAPWMWIATGPGRDVVKLRAAR